MELSRYAALFLVESQDHVAAVNHLLLALERNPGDREPVEGIFRAVHTVKGMSATMGYRAVTDVAHEMENLLERVRRGRTAPAPDLLQLLFLGADALERAVEASAASPDLAVAPAVEDQVLLARLRAAAEAAPTTGPVADEPRPTTLPALGDWAGIATEGGAEQFAVEVSFDSVMPGVRAALAIRRARELGEVSDLQPPEDGFGASDYDGILRFRLRSAAPATEVQRVLAAVGETRRVDVRGGPSGEVALGAPRRRRGAEEPTTDTPLGDGAGAPGAAPAVGVRNRQLRVDVGRLDALMNGIGELVIVRDRLQALVSRYDDTELEEATAQASRLTGELQDEIMRVRMVPVAQTFDRFPRLVRDAARTLGKQVELLMQGGEIEFDRAMLDEIVDPLVHLLRNAVDHGIEAPADRRAAGKPATGTIRLSAARERSRVVIVVEEDGRGIQRERVLDKAVRLGWVSEEVAPTLSDEQVYGFLLQPGFSTADRVTDVSGRGVGLDVVATRARSLGGVLEIASTPGQGTRFTLRLPSTLAIVQALLVELGTDTFALPLAHVEETVEFREAEMRQVAGRTVALLRDDPVPILQLGKLLRRPDQASKSDHRRSTVILEAGDQRLGLEVDALLGQREIVVKQFDATVDTLRIFSGATILSDGRPALILDVGSIVGGGVTAAGALLPGVGLNPVTGDSLALEPTRE